MPRRRKHAPAELNEHDARILDLFGTFDDVFVPSEVLTRVEDTLAFTRLNKRQLVALRCIWQYYSELFGALRDYENNKPREPALTREQYATIIGTLNDLQTSLRKVRRLLDTRRQTRTKHELRIFFLRHQREIRMLAPYPRGRKPQWPTRIAGEMARELSGRFGDMRSTRVLQLPDSAACDVALACAALHKFAGVHADTVRREMRQKRKSVAHQWGLFAAHEWDENSGHS
jgi:hypothetical protein